MASEHPSTLKDSPPDQTDNSRSSSKSKKPASASSGDLTDGVGGSLTTHEAESGFDSATKDISTKDSRRDSVADIERKLRYLKFQDYEFDNDDQFQSGWKTLSSVVPSVERDKHYLRAKLFYYSKHIEAVDIEEYMKWKENPLNQTEVKAKTGVATPQVQQLEDKGGNSCSPAATTEDSDKNTVSESGTLTFSEVIDFIQSGKTIPGLKTVDVKPTDADPSPSVMGRKPKPWER